MRKCSIYLKVINLQMSLCVFFLGHREIALILQTCRWFLLTVSHCITSCNGRAKSCGCPRSVHAHTVYLPPVVVGRGGTLVRKEKGSHCSSTVILPGPESSSEILPLTRLLQWGQGQEWNLPLSSFYCFRRGKKKKKSSLEENFRFHQVKAA